MVARRTAALGMACLLLTACVALPSPDAEAPCAVPPVPSSVDGGDIYLPTYCPMQFLPAAQVTGRLVEAGGCLWLESAGRRVLPLWPSGSTIEQEGESLIVVNGDGTRAVVGSRVSGGGGAYSQEALVETIGEEVPEACRADEYVLVYEMR